MKSQSQSFRDDHNEAKKREQVVLKAMEQVVKRLGRRLPDCSRKCIPDDPLAYFTFDRPAEAKAAEKMQSEVEQLLTEELVKLGITPDPKRMKVFFIPKKL
jgi:hypothetical protein